MRGCWYTIVSRSGAAIACLLLTACALHSPRAPGVSSLDPLLSPAGELAGQAAAASVETPDLLGLSDEMRDFARRYLSHGSQRQRLLTLHRSLRSPALVDIRYDPGADGTAAQAFARGSANCLTYAHVFIAMARHIGLEARYLSVTLRPEWARHGDRVARRQHVNVVVSLRNGEQFVVDIDPIARDKIATADVLGDKQAFALYHSNLAMEALLDGQTANAFAHAARSIELASQMEALWVNLGAIYRLGGQPESARRSYEVALLLNPESGSAMNNLAVLYQAAGNLVASREWQSRAEAYRLRNPYYHINLGEQAESAGDIEAAIEHYKTAVSLKRWDAEFYFRLARVYHALQQQAESVRYARLAIEHSRLVGEREQYESFLRQISTPTLAQALVKPG